MKLTGTIGTNFMISKKIPKKWILFKLLLAIFVISLGCQTKTNNETQIVNRESNQNFSNQTDKGISKRFCEGLKCYTNADCGSYCFCSRHSNSKLGDCIVK